MKLNLKQKRIVILGLQGSGKTNLAKYLLRQTKNHFVFDIIGEYQGFNRYIPSVKQYSEELLNEFDLCVNKIIIPNAGGMIQVFCIDEANRIAPNKARMPETLTYLNDMQRHLGLTLITIARRPSQLNTDLIDLAHYIILFKLTGWHDLQYLEKIRTNLSEIVANLSQYNFVVIDENRNVTVFEPVPLI